MVSTRKSNKKSAVVEKKTRRKLVAVSLIALIIKVFVIIRIQGFDWYQAGAGDLGRGLGAMLDNNFIPPNAWLGADGENYIRGLQGLVVEGFFSKEGKLSYWPAGYPLLMWPLIEVFRGYFFMALAISQSLLYTLGSIWFVDEIRKTRVSKVSFILACFLAFNPTLSLNTISVGYELPVVALSLLSTAAMLHYFQEKKRGLFNYEVFVAASSFALASLMQPRLLIIAVVFFLIWAMANFKIVLMAPFLALTLGLVSVAPGIMVFRNHQAHGYSAISTNLGVTMRLGAGPEASGGYSSNASGAVPCVVKSGNPSQVDNAIVRCVVNWYLENPSKAAVLFWNKARFFWSPWFGPEANGTMARNPWNQNHPLRPSASAEGNVVDGDFGKLVSWAWMICGLALMAFGFFLLWRQGDLERLLALMAASSFLINLVSSMLTIGDHRFRIPSMGMSIFLQAVGLSRIITKNRDPFNKHSDLVKWPGLRRPRPLN